MRVLVTVLMVVALAGCGPARPGAAATVDGTTISMRQVDEAAAALCRIGGASGEPAATEQRRLAVSMLILQALAESESERLDLQISRSSLQITQADRREVSATFGQDTDAILEVLDARLLVLAVAEQLGARERGVTSPDGLDEAERHELRAQGTELLMARLAETDVDIDPRLGLNSELVATAATGSLSAGESFESPYAPPAQRCG